MTLTEFRGMPGLISRKRFMQVTGLDRRDIEALVKAGKLRVFRRPAGMQNADCGLQNGGGEGRDLNAKTAKSAKEGKNVKHFSGQRRGVYGRYYTVEAARLCGFDLNK